MSRLELSRAVSVSERSIQWWSETGLLQRRGETRVEWAALIAVIRERRVPLSWIRKYMRRLVEPGGAFLLITADHASAPRWFETAADLITAAAAHCGGVVVITRQQVQARIVRKKTKPGGHYVRRGNFGLSGRG